MSILGALDLFDSLLIIAVPCKTVGDKGKPCVFPFEYSGRSYDKCTSRDSDNGQPWCATEVDENGYVVDNAWGDCLEGCPGTSQLLECSIQVMINFFCRSGV